MITELWKPVPGWEDRYEVSNLGRAFSLVRNQILKTKFDSRGYGSITVQGEGKVHARFIQGLVAEAFIGPRPSGAVVRHLDGHPSHNELSNLVYGTPRENKADQFAHGAHSHDCKLCLSWREFVLKDCKMNCSSLSGEFWLPIPGFIDYQVSDFGRVKSSKRGGRILRPGVNDASGHLAVSLYQNGGTTRKTVHQLVMLAFVGSCPEGLVVRHLDGDPTNNYLSNIKYDTKSENSLDVVRHGRNMQANKTHCPQGHEYTSENTYISKSGWRICRTCGRERTTSLRVQLIESNETCIEAECKKIAMWYGGPCAACYARNRGKFARNRI